MWDRDAAPAGVARNCTPGRTPGKPRRLLRAGLGPGTVERESGNAAWRADWRGFFFLPRLLGAPHPLALGDGERDGPTPSPTKAGAGIALAMHCSSETRGADVATSADHSIACKLRDLTTVMPGLVPGIHVFRAASKTWMAGTSPAMTNEGSAQVETAPTACQISGRWRKSADSP